MLVKAPNRSPEDLAGLQQFSQNGMWFRAHRKELVTKYPDQWVAVHLEEVVGVDEDLEGLMIRMKASYGSIGTMYFGFAATKPKVWVI